MNNFNIIEVRNLSVTFSKKQVLKKIDLDINPYKMTCLLGASGTGKTIFLKSLLGLLKADRGFKKIIKDSNGDKIKDRDIPKKIGYMAQDNALYPDYSAQEHLELFSALHKIKDKERWDMLLSLVDLNNDRKKAVKYFSGGMKKRLSLVLTLLHNPDILILDEPTVGVDPMLRLRFQNLFNQLTSNKKTILLTTHVMDEAEHADQIIFFKDGTVLENESKEKLKEKYNDASMTEIFLRILNKKEEN